MSLSEEEGVDHRERDDGADDTIGKQKIRETLQIDTKSGVYICYA